jgi:DNA end-binding protein Ku
VAEPGGWTGFLKLSFVTCAVRMIPAVTASDRISFHMINPETGNRIRMKPHDAETDEVVERSDLVKGYEYDKDEYVLFEDDEIAKLKIEASHTIEITRFVKADDIDRRYFDSPYYLVPDGKVAVEAYKVIQEAVAAEDLVGLATLVMANRERPVAIEPRGRGLLVTRLRAPEDLRDDEPLFEHIPEKPADKQMVDMAKTLIDKMSGKFDPKLFEDRYQAALQELVEAKLKGVKPKLPKAPRTAEVINLFDALKKSVAGSGGSASARKPAKGGRKVVSLANRRRKRAKAS